MMAVDAIERHRANQDAQRRNAGPGWNDYGVVFCNGIGRPLWRSQIRASSGNLWLRRVYRICASTTSATLLLAEGVPAKVASELLGALGRTDDAAHLRARHRGRAGASRKRHGSPFSLVGYLSPIVREEWTMSERLDEGHSLLGELFKTRLRELGQPKRQGLLGRKRIIEGHQFIQALSECIGLALAIGALHRERALDVVAVDYLRSSPAEAAEVQSWLVRAEELGARRMEDLKEVTPPWRRFVSLVVSDAAGNSLGAFPWTEEDVEVGTSAADEAMLTAESVLAVGLAWAITHPEDAISALGDEADPIAGHFRRVSEIAATSALDIYFKAHPLLS